MNARFQNKAEKDLFGQFQTADKEIRKKTRFLLPDIKRNLNLSYENVIFLVIGFVMACVICFTLGVERGKRHPGYTMGPERIAMNKAMNKTVSIDDLAVEQKTTVEKPVTKDEYVIQLAAFKKKISAEQGQAELRKTGYSAAIKQSGEYYQLYIGGFKSRKEAEGLFSKIKSIYKDCYIKKY